MFSFLYSTDWHVKGKNPVTRKDDYSQTLELKLKDFFETGHRLGVDAFLAGGDFFDSPFTSSEVVTKFGKIVEEGLKDKHLYGVWGNHDVVGWNPKTVKKSSIGVFQEFCKSFTILDREPIVLEKDGLKVNLTGVSAHAMLDTEVLDDEGNVIKHRAADWIVSETNGNPHIHIVHGYLSPVPVLDGIRHSLISEMKHTKALITLGAHEHTGFPVTKIDNGYVYNPGALGRIKASYEEMNRMPRYAHVIINDDGTGEIMPVPCSVAEKGTEVLDRSVIDEKRAKEAKIKLARENIKDVLQNMNIKMVDLRTILEGYKEDTKPEVYQEVRKRLRL